MAKAKEALETPPTLDPIDIILTGSSWAPYPVASSVQPDGTVQFVPNKAAWVWTMLNSVGLTDVFLGQSNNYVQVLPGQPNTFMPTVQNGDTITIIPLNPNSNPPEASAKEKEKAKALSVRGTIKVSST